MLNWLVRFFSRASTVQKKVDGIVQAVASLKQEAQNTHDALQGAIQQLALDAAAVKAAYDKLHNSGLN